MSQILSQIPRQLLRQEQRLTPQLIQAMDILQLNALALESRIAQEVDGNPALEVLPGDEDVPEVSESAAEESSGGDDERALVVGDGSGAEFERLDSLVREYDWIDDEYRGSYSRSRADEAADSKQEAMNNAVARPPSLQEHLDEQWSLVDVSPRIRDIGTRIIAELDDNGRLTTALQTIAQDLDPPASMDELLFALREVQLLDPPGVAARNLQECLLLQLDALPGENELERRILQEHFDDLQRNRIPQIAKALGVEVDEVKAAIEVIGRLSLSPGSDLVATPAPAVVPDLVVEYDEAADRYDVRLARGNLRELRISPEFRELLERSRGDPKTREYVKQKIEAAAAIVDAVRFRRERLLEVGRHVVAAQRDFLDRGEKHLRILRMSDLAERLGCDPSTISRTVDEKYVQTPRGVYPLRFFFTGGAATDEGEELGWASIRAKVEEIIAGEDKSNPLSDDEIVARLSQAGVEIKRRTVAKYRAQLNIPPARQRRRY
ncbi:MAG: RNA polymerase factor sigma-54 [Phycisphaerales bacterium]|nr:RNA polymerase factor sigma-54 [Phycisphaerales bacterium]